jgi:hypothetical protein
MGEVGREFSGVGVLRRATAPRVGRQMITCCARRSGLYGASAPTLSGSSTFAAVTNTESSSAYLRPSSSSLQSFYLYASWTRFRCVIVRLRFLVLASSR